MREVAIFRHNLFKLSEPFIAGQACRLHRYMPFFLGRLRCGPPPAGALALALEDLRPWAWPRLGWQMLSRAPGPYLRLLAGRHPALIHAHFGIEGVHALPLAGRLGAALVTTFHGFDATLSDAAFFASPAWMHYPLFRRRLAGRGDLFIAASAFIARRLLALGFPESRLRVHYIGVDCAAIRPREETGDAPVVLHVARLVEVKGTEYLIRAFARLPRRHGDAKLVIVGDGPLRRRLESLAAALGVAQRTRFLGALPHAVALAWMRKAAIAVLPSVRARDGRVEGLGLVLLEAAAAGVPVIGSRSGGIPEGIVEGQTGLLTAERDVAGLGAGLCDLLDDAGLRRRMGLAARALAERRFDIETQTAILEGYYDGLLA